MEKYSFERALRCKSGHYKLIGAGVEKLSSKLRAFRLIKMGFPLPIERINNNLRLHLDELEYIQFWSEVEIYRVHKFQGESIC